MIAHLAVLFSEMSAHLAVLFSEMSAHLIVLSLLTWIEFLSNPQPRTDSCHPDEGAPLPGESHLRKIRDIMLLTTAAFSIDCINV
jgi:hypothetical protein